MPDAPAPLALPLTGLRGIGVERAAQLARLDLHTVGDLLRHRPRRHEDRRACRRISELTTTEAATARGTIVAQGLKRFAKGRKSVFEIILQDASGRLHCRWWNLPFMERYFQVGDEVFAHGKLVGLKPRTMDHAETEVVVPGEKISIHLQRIVPIYPLTDGLPQRWLRSLLWRLLEEFGSHLPEPDYQLPAASSPALPTRAEAIRQIHFPAEMTDVETARQRLALDELVELQTAIQLRRRRLLANARGLTCHGDNRLIKPFLAQLGFTLTAAQARVLREIRHDLASGQPMRRLLQGDVGSGKTVVAACTALMALESGHNAALMVPTEILADQHQRTFRRWFEPLGLAVRVWTGSHKEAAPGDRPMLLIGTHALVTEAFHVERLGLVVIDEQHKFGVAQREQLVRKGHFPHLLVMTATPIPRTLGLTLYGDLDCSVIDQSPAGRGRIKTFIRTADKLPKVWEFLREQLRAGRQAYIVYPRVEAGDLKSGAKAVTQEWDKLRAALAPFEVGLLHGRLAAREKEQVMRAFQEGRTSVLLATSVIEVGIDVPNATILVIEGAEQFGLAQLHQLRGRIGRGAQDSHCILVAGEVTDDARGRLEVLARTSDGFEIAEADLRLRGPGELLGQSQSGLPPFRFTDLTRDLALAELARRIVKAGT